MDENIDVNSLEDIPTGQLTEDEKDAFHGTKTVIASAVVKKKQVPFAEEYGKMLPEGQTREVVVVEIETKSIGTNKLGQPVTVREEFPLKRHPVTGKWGPSRHEKSKSDKFFKILKINGFAECINKPVLVIKKVRQSGTTYLGLSI